MAEWRTLTVVKRALRLHQGIGGFSQGSTRLLVECS